MTFSLEQLNFFKFSTVVLDEFPVALRQVFVSMWDTLVTSPPRVPKWDDSVTVLNLLLAKEGGVKKVPTLNKSYKEWDCTALFKATLFAQNFAMPDGTGGVSTLDKLYVKPRGLSAGTFHHSVISATGNQAEAYALALDQLRLLRNTLCHQISTRRIDKATFDNYILLAKDAFTLLGLNTTKIDETGKLDEDDFPTTRRLQLEDELKREKVAAIKFKQIDDHLTKIESQVDDVGSDVKDVKTEVTNVKTQMKDVGSDVKDVKTEVTNVKRKVEDVGSDVKRLKTELTDLKTGLNARIDDKKEDLQTGSSKVPDSCIPAKIPHFVGRQKECQAVLNRLTNGDTRLVVLWGSPGFGKTSVANNVAQQLKEKKIPVYFTSLRGMKSEDDLVSRLLSIFAYAKEEEESAVSPSDRAIKGLRQLKNPSVLILDNADDLLESGDTELKDDFIRFTEEILAQCSHIKLLFTTRQSLHYLSHKLLIYEERVYALDKDPSVSLVRQSLGKPVSDNDCNRILNVCGRVPLAMRLMCGIMKEQNVSLAELLEELKDSPLVEVLGAPLKTIINSSFERLTDQDRDAFVSLAVFPSFFGVKEATAVLVLTRARQTKKVIQSLKRKSLIDCNDNFKSFAIHPLLRSFIDERRITNQAIETIFHAAQLRFYDYHISSFEAANEKFLTGHSDDAWQVFSHQQENILLSLETGAKDDALYPKVVKVLSKAELFLFALPNIRGLLHKLYSTTVEEAKKRQRRDDECNLLAAKSFASLDQSLQAGVLDTDSYPAKHLCYLGVGQVLCGKTDDGISFLRASVDRLNDDCDEKVLKVLAYHVLAVCCRKKGDMDNASKFETSCRDECKSTSFCPAVRDLLSQDTSLIGKETNLDSIVEQDVYFFRFMATFLFVLYDKVVFGKEKCCGFVFSPVKLLTHGRVSRVISITFSLNSFSMSFGN